MNSQQISTAQRASIRKSMSQQRQRPMPCGICQRVTTDRVADHCHASGRSRDWICRACNAGLGMFQDNPAALRAAAEYLERHARHPMTPLTYCADQLATFHPRAQQRAVSADLAARAEHEARRFT